MFRAAAKQCLSQSRIVTPTNKVTTTSLFNQNVNTTKSIHYNKYFNNNNTLFNNKLISSPLYYSTNNNHNNSNNNEYQQQQQQQNNNNNNSNFKYMVPLLGAGFIIPLFFLAVEDGEVAQPPPNIDIQKIYSSKSTSELMFSFFILKLCTFKIFSENGSAFINFANNWGLSVPMNFIVKHTFFKQFCAGETIDETEEFTKKLNDQGIGTILDYSVEDKDGTPESFDHVASQIQKTIAIAAKYPDYSFSCVKVTGLTGTKLMEKLNQIVLSAIQQKQQLPADFITSPTAIYAASNLLSDSEKVEMVQLMNRLDSIFAECYRSNVPILVDAEQSYYQAAIHHIAIAFSAKYNKSKPLIYNTYQMYLSQGLNMLNDHLALSKQLGFKLGAKVVRGAYMVSERKRAEDHGYPSPILPNIQETHHSYFTAMETLLKDSSNIGIMFATHNEQSVNFGVERMKQLNIDPKNPNIQFGQLFGMADFLSLNLVNQNQRVFKYVPYGPVQEVLPYLIRRMQENRGFIGSNSATELLFLKKEIKRRLFGSK